MKYLVTDVARFKRLAAIVALTTMLAACSDESNAPQSVAAPAAGKPAAKAEAKPVDPTANLSRAVLVGKSAAPIELKYDIVSLPLVGQPIEIDMAFVASAPADSVSIAFVGSRGLVLSANSASPIEKLKTGQVEHAKVIAQADKEDVFYVTVTATVYMAGTSEVKTFAIPIIVGTAQAAAAVAAPVAPAPPAAKK